MELRVTLLLLLCCTGLQAETPEAEMSQQEGSTFSIQCPYTTQPENEQLKAWCRMRNERCQLEVLTLDSVQYRYSDRAMQGHITIKDYNRTVSITMSDLQAEDSGIYSCVYSNNYVPLKTISLNVYKELHKWELDSLSVQCPYGALGYSWGRKAWCRQGQAQCSLVVSTVYPSTWGSNGARNKSSSIQDDTRTRTVTITMDKLQVQDSGVYWCALYNPNQRPAFIRIMEVRLSVDKSLPAQTAEAEISQQEGSTFSIQCPYTTQPENEQLKAWCRMRNARCQLVAWTLASMQYIYSDRARQGHLTIQDDNRTVSITMSDLQAEDSGIYSCVYSSNYVPLKTISLNVYKELHKWELDSLSVQCPYGALGYSWGRKAWCRQGQAQCSLVVSTVYSPKWGSNGARNKSSSIQDDTRTRTVTITMDKLQVQDSGVYWCALYNPNQRPAFIRIMEVRLSVDKIPAATTLSVTTSSSQKNSSGNSTQPRNTITISVVLCILLILAFTITTALCIRQRKKLKTGGNRQAEDIYDKPESPAQLESTENMGRTTDDSRDLNYITLDFKPRLSSDEPLYCNVEPSQAPRKPEDENVEYAIITHKQLPKNDKG
ncbi:triggering receptor expressed on myeloid cells isoform 3 precursor [Gallus gallus]|uniref:triggering receptor expressed on myeloid cells isoform 3 precursor n=1 Tax=Gallus gallus TaxID=9031 RepID=UPI001CBA626F|nr:triggering receptor expressed on myeloid cells isoform 3 precursor [Gallus gallus]